MGQGDRVWMPGHLMAPLTRWIFLLALVKSCEHFKWCHLQKLQMSPGWQNQAWMGTTVLQHLSWGGTASFTLCANVPMASRKVALSFRWLHAPGQLVLGYSHICSVWGLSALLLCSANGLFPSGQRHCQSHACQIRGRRSVCKCCSNTA